MRLFPSDASRMGQSDSSPALRGGWGDMRFFQAMRPGWDRVIVAPHFSVGYMRFFRGASRVGTIENRDFAVSHFTWLAKA
jgi:hypothetical protein